MVPRAGDANLSSDLRGVLYRSTLFQAPPESNKEV